MSEARPRAASPTIGAGEAPPVLARLVRGEIVEAAHRGDVAIVGPGGELRAALGAPARLVSLRSAVKPFTAVAVLCAAEAAGIAAGIAAWLGGH